MKILIVVDVQNDFVDGSLGTNEAIQIVENVKRKVLNFEGEILYTMDTHYSDYLETQEGKKLPVIHCQKGTEGWNIRNGVYKEGCEIFEKNTFGSVDLAKYLEELSKTEKIESIELIGICTDICVVSNAFLIKAFLPEIPITVDKSCCAGVTVQTHNSALEVMKMCQINVE